MRLGRSQNATYFKKKNKTLYHIKSIVTAQTTSTRNGEGGGGRGHVKATAYFK